LIRVLRRFRRKIMWVKNCIIAPPFMDGWIKTRLGAGTFNKTASCRGLSAAAQAAVWNNALISSIIFD
jgi:hypothetical protein